MKREHAEAINKLMFEYADKLSDSIRLVMEHDSPEVFDAHRQAVGRVMGEMWCEILAPIYKEHPDLMPDEIKTPSQLAAQRHG